MKITLFESALCCSTGICGPEPDLTLIQLQQLSLTLADRGIKLHRFAINQQPLAFTSETVVRETLKAEGPQALPLTIIDGNIIKKGAYPTMEDLRPFIPELADARPAPRILGQF